jgi:hypothetical protein
MEQGVVFGRDMLGYDVRGGKMSVNEDGAKIVRLIFDKFVTEGKGCHTIARELREAGVKSYTNNQEWSNTVILRLIRNEKYCGDLVQKKTFTPDYLTHEKKYNRGEEEFIILRDHHEPLISREMFDKANAILDSRALSQEGKAKHSNRYAFSGKIKCALCGSTYAARFKPPREDGTRYKAWRCFKAAQGKGCSNSSIRNEDAAHIMGLIAQSLDLNGILHGMFGDVSLDETFFRHILERMVIHNRDRVDVYLKFLPHRWSYAAGGAFPLHIPAPKNWATLK